MSQNPLRNIRISTFRDFLEYCGCKCLRTTGGHEHWGKNGLNRPITFQTHVDPIPEHIVKNALRTLGMTANDYVEFLKS